MALIRTASMTVRRLQCSSVGLNLFCKTLQDGRSCSVQHPYSTNASNLNLTVDTAEGIAVIELKRKPVNSLNLEFLTELNTTLEKLENDRQIKGLIITSGQPKIFSAGLDIMELYNPKPDRVREFWRTLQNFWMRLYVSPLATVAAINGNSPAGGCLLALSCDHRVMASGRYVIGLNETLLGLAAPFWIMESLKNVIGHRESERALQTGRLYSAEEALKVGLVDEVVAESDVIQHAKDELNKWLQVPDDHIIYANGVLRFIIKRTRSVELEGLSANSISFQGHARQLTKLALRKPTVDRLVKGRDEDIETLFAFITRDAIQKGLARYLELLSLQRKK